ncbi:MAG: DUF87 domain-containing protein [Clostridia bacterium]|nr:DUF87 domain-containing protein [Clostridia bacterium]
MGIKNIIAKVGQKTGNKVAKLSALSPDQLVEVQKNREKYLSEMPDPTDSVAVELTNRLLAASGVEIFNAYLPQLSKLYVPISKDVEYTEEFRPEHNIRYFNITKWVTDKKENNLEKLVNVYEVLSNEECNIALIFRRRCEITEVYLAVTNTKNADNSVDINNFKERLAGAIRGNFPGSEWKDDGIGVIPFLDGRTPYSVASASNIPTEKSEKFISQTIEKLLDGYIPDTADKEYTIILLATPIQDVAERKLRLSEIYSGLVPYSSWQTNFTYNENNAVNSAATIGVNVGASAGIQNGQNQSVTNSDGKTDSLSKSETDSKGQNITDTNTKTETNSQGTTKSESNSHTKGSNKSRTKTEGTNDSVGVGAFQSVSGGVNIFGLGANATAGLSESYNHGWSKSTAETVADSVSDSVTKAVAKNITKSSADSVSKSVGNTVGHSIANTLGRAVSQSVAKTAGVFSSTNFGLNFGANFARSSSVTATIGKGEGITQSHINYNIQHALELIQEQMKRYEQSTALGMWDFAAYVLSEDQNVANNVAHSYIALTQGEQSYMSQVAINLWRGDMADNSGDAKEICKYLRELRHPLFALNPDITEKDATFNVYPAVVTATTSLSGKELAYSLNFPQKSVSGLPVIECTEFGRNIVTYDTEYKKEIKLKLGHIFHMNHQEKGIVSVSKSSLASHTFITGSTGSGKSNAVYQLLNEARNNDIKFLVVEPAKGEYKSVFGMENDVSVYGTNPELTPMLRINPFSFPKGIHILEHLDRLVEIFNVCWPMYAAMPAVLKSAVEKSYSDCGWNLNTSKNKYGENIFPTFADVAENVKKIIDSSEYDTDNKGAYKGALLTRLESLTNGINGMIFVQDEIDTAKLFDKNVIIDLSRVGSSETKSLIMGMLVLKLQEYRMTTTDSINAELNHITVLEEAHNILKRTSTEQSSEGANLLGKSVEMLANAIAEMRTYGEGFVIVDQAPGLLDLSTIRNTNTKIIMRLPDLSDRELVGKAANLNDDQITELAKLPCGVAAVYQNEWIQPVLCKVNKYSGEEVPYSYDINDDEDIYGVSKNNLVKESLLDFIMSKEILRKGDVTDIQKLKDMVIKSKLNTGVKCDFIEYISSEKDNAIPALRKLIYDFLDAGKAIQASKNYNNIREWVHAVVNELEPSIKHYSKQQIDLVIALLLYEQSIREADYYELFGRFTEIYRDDGGVF